MSRAERLPRAVIDADIIYSRVLHDLMGRIAGRLEPLELVWSRELLAEAKRALMHQLGHVLGRRAGRPAAVRLDLLEPQASNCAGGRPITELLDALQRPGAGTFASAARRLVDGNDAHPVG